MSIHEWIQQGAISDEIAKKRGIKELVRCKDCKWHTMRGEMLLCTAQDKPHTYDWFCADGERRTVDA